MLSSAHALSQVVTRTLIERVVASWFLSRGRNIHDTLRPGGCVTSSRRIIRSKACLSPPRIVPENTRVLLSAPRAALQEKALSQVLARGAVKVVGSRYAAISEHRTRT